MTAHHDGVHWITTAGGVVALSLSETICHCGKCDSNTMTQRIVDLFDVLRKQLNIPLRINNGFRCAEHNKAVGGKPNSQHLYGNALDVHCPASMSVDQLAEAMHQAGVTACGRYYKTKFCHMDGRESTFSWTDVHV